MINRKYKKKILKFFIRANDGTYRKNDFNLLIQEMIKRGELIVDSHGTMYCYPSELKKLKRKVNEKNG